MRAYLDNNIFVSIEDTPIELNILTKLSEQKVDFVYSYAHISELLEANDNTEELIKKRINTIEKVTDNFYAYPVGDSIEFKKENPKNVIEIFNRYPNFFASIRNSIKSYNPDRERLIQLLGIDKKQINNYSTKEVVRHLNTILTKEIPFDFIQMVNRAGTALHGQIYAVFNFLDYLGYWTDKRSNKSNIARANDASHVFFATACDYFVSDDRRARNKAKVAYELFEINTQIYSFEEFKKIII
jgi:hypothetical protein